MIKHPLKLAFLYLLFLGLFSCGKKEASESQNWTLEPSGEKLRLPLDEQTPNLSMGISYYEAEKPLLFNIVSETNSLQIYDLEDKKLAKTLTFEREGDQGIELAYFHVHNLDSIFLFPVFGNQFVLTDTSGIVKSRIRYELPAGYPMLFVHNSYYVSPPHIAGGELIAKVRADGRPSQITQAQLDTWALAAAIDLETGSVRMLPQRFPKDYLSSGQKQLEYSLLIQENRTLVSFMGDHQVYFSDLESSQLEPKEAKSQYLDEIMPTFSKDVDGRGFNEYSFTKSRYESLVFDPYRKVYYRFAFPTITVESDDQLRALRSAPGPFVVMVLDEELNVLTERRFDAGIYLPSNFFVGEKGLHLSLNHPDNPENKEDEFAFELIQLKK